MLNESVNDFRASSGQWQISSDNGVVAVKKQGGTWEEIVLAREERRILVFSPQKNLKSSFPSRFQHLHIGCMDTPCDMEEFVCCLFHCWINSHLNSLSAWRSVFIF